MSEGFTNVIEQEIEQLSREIEAKRRELESQRGVSHESAAEKEILRTALSEKISASLPVPVSTPASLPASSAPSTGSSYLDDLDADTAEKVNVLIQEVFSKGLERALKDVKKYDPYVMDAFHDALVDRMWEELKARKQVQ